MRLDKGVNKVALAEATLSLLQGWFYSACRFLLTSHDAIVDLAPDLLLEVRLEVVHSLQLSQGVLLVARLRRNVVGHQRRQLVQRHVPDLLLRFKHGYIRSAVHLVQTRSVDVDHVLKLHESVVTLLCLLRL